ncbi:MAG TPA: exodeoxyribonuclease III [Clostridia bacterium]|nr:exodeoxyribonuclease III [Clostridia bacterium]
MRIYSWNVNGIRAVQKKGFIEWVKEEQPDILCLQETKAHLSQLDDELINIEGYESYWNYPERKGYSGVALYTKTEPKSVYYGIGIDIYDEEGRIIVAEYDDFVLLNIYFPNGQMSDERLKYKLDFYDAVLKYCNMRVAQGDKVVVSGDYNTAHSEIDLKNPKSNADRSGFLPIERAWMDKLVKSGYTDTYRYLYPDTVKYSWWSYRFRSREKNIGWRIDYHFVSNNMLDRVKDSLILNHVMGSDHCPIMLELIPKGNPSGK